MNGLFMTQSLKKKSKLEEEKTDEYYSFKTSEDSEDDNIFNVVVGHVVSTVVSEIILKSREQRGKSKVCHSYFSEQGFYSLNEFKLGMRVSREILNYIYIYIYTYSIYIYIYIITERGEYTEKTPTSFTLTHVQLALTLYRLSNGCT